MQSETVYKGVDVTFDAGQSKDSDGTIDRYDWKIVHGQKMVASGQGKTFTTSLSNIGNHDVSLTVTCNEGCIKSTSTTIHVEDTPFER